MIKCIISFNEAFGQIPNASSITRMHLDITVKFSSCAFFLFNKIRTEKFVVIQFAQHKLIGTSILGELRIVLTSDRRYCGVYGLAANMLSSPRALIFRLHSG